MTQYLTQYLEIHAQMLLAREANQEQLEDDLLDQLDILWYKMDEYDREVAHEALTSG